MKKICRQCNLYYDETDIICSECGSKLERAETNELTQNVDSLSAMPSSGNITQDNRIHRGNKINIDGDCIQAGGVVNRNTTNNTNTTINNIQNVEELVKCSISGRWIAKKNSYECPICKRTVAGEYYIHRKRMCEDCAEKAEQNALSPFIQSQTMSGTAPSNKIPPVMPSYNPTEPIIMTPIKQSGNKHTVQYTMIGIAVLLVIIVGWIWYTDYKDGNSQPYPVTKTMLKTAEDMKNTPSPQSSPAIRKTVQTSQTTTSPATAQEGKTLVEENKVEKPDPLVQGKQAYELKNYSAAKVFLEEAIKAGSPQAGYYLSQLYMKGNGVPKNVKRAFDNMKLAAEGGYTEAFFELAEMYRTGKGTEPSRPLAKKWYEESVKSNTSNADKASKALSKYN